MVNFKAQIQNMVDRKMNFGSFYASMDGLTNKYGSPQAKINDNSGTLYFVGDNHTDVATAQKKVSKDGKKVQASIHDNTTGISYKTGWHNNEHLKNDIKFEQLTIGNITIQDNGNHYVDENDKICIYQKGLGCTHLTVGAYLSGNYEKAMYSDENPKIQLEA